MEIPDLLSWDMKPTTDRQKYICQQILQNRRKSCYGQKDGNALTLEQLRTIIPDLQTYEISELLLLGILTAKDNGYDFYNAKQSAGIDGVYRVVSATGVYPTITATQNNDYVLTDKAVARLEKWKQNKNTSVWTGDQNSTHTPTIRSTYYKDCTKITLNENNVLRKLTPRECALLQGFPTDFIIPVSNTQAYKQLGNAVSVNVVKAILEQI